MCMSVNCQRNNMQIGRAISSSTKRVGKHCICGFVMITNCQEVTAIDQYVATKHDRHDHRKLHVKQVICIILQVQQQKLLQFGQCCKLNAVLCFA